MDVTTLDPVVQRLLQAGLAPSTQRAYTAGKRKYLSFCQKIDTDPLPVTEQKLLLFVAFAVKEGLKQQTIRSYLSAVRHLQVSCGGGDPRANDMPQLALALRGAKREQAGAPKQCRLPITPAILLKMRAVWQKSAKSWNHIMLWAACCVGFFGFLRAGEFTAPEDAQFDPKAHLSFSDVAVDNPDSPRLVSLRIKQSKTDQFRTGVTIYLGSTDSALCPVVALLAFLAIRGPGDGPLFKFEDGQPLTRSRLVVEVRRCLLQAGLSPQDYAGHSLRIGAATTAAACGVPAEVIMSLGRWKSAAYKLYIRLPRDQLAEICRSMASCVDQASAV